MVIYYIYGSHHHILMCTNFISELFYTFIIIFIFKDCQLGNEIKRILPYIYVYSVSMFYLASTACKNHISYRLVQFCIHLQEAYIYVKIFKAR